MCASERARKEIAEQGVVEGWRFAGGEGRLRRLKVSQRTLTADLTQEMKRGRQAG